MSLQVPQYTLPSLSECQQCEAGQGEGSIYVSVVVNDRVTTAAN